jgi:hypothetical protein
VVEVLNDFIVAALDDLEPTRETESLNPDGTYTKYVGQFGMSRGRASLCVSA